MAKSTRLAMLFASTAISVAIPVTSWATTCDSPDFSNSSGSPTLIPSGTTSASGCVTGYVQGGTSDYTDYFTFQNISAGTKKFTISYSDGVNFGYNPGSTGLVNLSGSGSTSWETTLASAGNINFLFAITNEEGFGSYSVSLDETSPVPLPGAIGLLGAGLAALGAVGNRRRAKRRG